MVPILLTCSLNGPPLCGSTVVTGDRFRVSFHAHAHLPGQGGNFQDVSSHFVADVKVVAAAPDRPSKGPDPGATGVILSVHVREASGTWEGAAVSPWQGHRYTLRWDGGELTAEGGSLSDAERGQLVDDAAQALSAAGISFPPAIRTWTRPASGATFGVADAPWMYNPPGGSVEGQIAYAGRSSGNDRFTSHLRSVDEDDRVRGIIVVDGTVAIDPERGWVTQADFNGTVEVQMVPAADGTVPAGRFGGVGQVVMSTSVERR